MTFARRLDPTMRRTLEWYQRWRPKWIVNGGRLGLDARDQKTIMRGGAGQLRRSSTTRLNQGPFAGPSVITVGSANFRLAGGVNSIPRYVDLGGKLWF